MAKKPLGRSEYAWSAIKIDASGEWGVGSGELGVSS